MERIDLLSLTPGAFRKLTAEQRREVSGAFSELTLEQQAQIIESGLPVEFRLTSAEKQRRSAAWGLADPSTWRSIAASNIKQIVRSYEVGHLDARETLEAVRRVAFGCWPPDQVRLLGEAALLMLGTTPVTKARGERAPRWPVWLKRATAELVLYEHERAPRRRRGPKHQDHVKEPSDRTSPAIRRALAVLESIGWFDKGVPTPGTVDDWVRARLKAR